MTTLANHSNYSLNWWLLNEKFPYFLPYTQNLQATSKVAFFWKNISTNYSGRRRSNVRPTPYGFAHFVRLHPTENSPIHKIYKPPARWLFFEKLRFICSTLCHLELVSGSQQFVRFVKQAQHNIRRKKIPQFTLFAQYNIYYLYQKGNNSSWQFSCTNLLYIRVVILCVYEYK